MSDVQIFQVLSIAYVAVGIGFLLNSGFYKKIFDDFVESPSTMYLGGMLGVVVGYLLVTFHNTWVKDWTVVITVIGWIALVKGVLILVKPKMMIAMIKSLVEKKNFMKIEAIVAIVIGLAFAGLGFCPKSPVF